MQIETRDILKASEGEVSRFSPLAGIMQIETL